MPSTALRIAAVCVAVLAVISSVASAGVLSSSRFKAIDAVYAAIQPVNDSSSPPTAAQLRRISAACARLDRRDGLLASQRRVCTAGVAFLRAGGAVRCASKDACVAELGRVIGTLRALLATSRADNRVISRLVDGSGCRKALRTTASDLAGYEAVLGGFRKMQRGLSTGSQTEYNRGQAEVEKVDISSEADSRAAFRRACG